MQQLVRKARGVSVALLLISSITPTGAFFGDDYSSFTEGAKYLSEEDIAFNLEQSVASANGFLIKSMPQDGESVKIQRTETIAHEVQEGQTLSTIADLYELNTDTLIWENNIVNVDDIKPSQTLSIPPSNGVGHSVQKGETISSIIAKYDDIEITEFRKFNGISGDVLRVGQDLFIPGGKRITETLVASNQPSTVPDTSLIANVTTDINANVLPDEPAPPPRDQIPNPNVAPIQGIQGQTNITKDSINVPDQPAVAPQNVAPSGRTWNNPLPGGIITQGYKSGHWALDIARTNGQIIAASDGVVVTAKNGWNGGYGNYIIIDHQNGYKTLYAHNRVLYVSVGDSVSQGQAIAEVGNTGRVYGRTGIHLHYECHKDGVRINPHSCI